MRDLKEAERFLNTHIIEGLPKSGNPETDLRNLMILLVHDTSKKVQQKLSEELDDEIDFCDATIKKMSDMPWSIELEKEIQFQRGKISLATKLKKLSLL